MLILIVTSTIYLRLEFLTMNSQYCELEGTTPSVCRFSVYKAD